MRNYSILILVALCSFSSILNASGTSNEHQHAKWAGEYKVTNCISCPDHAIDQEYNLKNIQYINFNHELIPADKQPACTNTNHFISTSYTLLGSTGGVSTHSSPASMCSWEGAPILNSAENSFRLSFSNASGQHILEIKKLTESSFELYLKSESETPFRLNYPKVYEYRVKAIKVN